VPLAQLSNVVHAIVVCQSFGQVHRRRGLHFHVEPPARLVGGQHVKYDQFVFRTVFSLNRIENLNLGNRPTPLKYGIQEMRRDIGMFGAPKHELERKIDFRVNTDRHQNDFREDTA